MAGAYSGGVNQPKLAGQNLQINIRAEECMHGGFASISSSAAAGGAGRTMPGWSSPQLHKEGHRLTGPTSL